MTTTTAPTTPSAQDEAFLRTAIAAAATSRAGGNHSIGALLVLDGSQVLEAGNTVVTDRDATGHAETNLVRLATRAYNRETLARANPENPTMALPCREVLASGQRAVEVVGPCLREETAAVHAGFWN